MKSVQSATNDDEPQIPHYEIPEAVADNIRQALRGLQFGEITISVRNGAVIQIERVARKRQFRSKRSD